MATITEAKRMIREIPPTERVEYLDLSDFGSSLDEYYVTVSESGEAVIWAWEDQRQYGYTSEPPSEDRRFDIAKLETIVKWLGRNESHADLERSDDSSLLQSVGYFSWDGSSVLLDLPCGDQRFFDLSDLELLVKALRSMKPLPDTFVPERF